MADVLTNKCSFTLGAAITSSTQTSITRTSATDGLPGDSNGPASGTYTVVMTDGSGNYELARVVSGQGTTTLGIARAVGLIAGTKTALASVPNGTVCYAVPIAEDLQASVSLQASSIVGGQQLVPVGPGGSGLKIVSGGFGVLFDGYTAQLLTPYSVLVSAGSVMFWFNPLRDLIVNPGAFWSNNQGYAAVQQYGTGSVNASVSQATTSASATDTAVLSSLAGAWHLYVFTFNATSNQLYRDGALVSSNAGLSGAPSGVATQMAFGYGACANNGATGGVQNMLAHCAFWDTTVLTAAEVAALYSNASSMTESAYEAYVVSLAPTLYYPMQENTGTVATNKGSTGSTDNGSYSGNYILGMPGPIGGQPTLQTSPPAPTGGIVITSGTAYQNTAPYDVFLRIPVTYNPLSGAAATLDVGVGPTAAPAQAVEDSQPAASTAGVIRTKDLYLPAGWYALVTATNATLGLASSQPI